MRFIKKHKKAFCILLIVLAVCIIPWKLYSTVSMHRFEDPFVMRDPSKHTIFSLDISEIVSISVQNGTFGNSVKYTSGNGLEEIVDQLNSFQYKHWNAQIPNGMGGWMYGIDIKAKNGTSQRYLIWDSAIKAGNILFTGSKNTFSNLIAEVEY